MTDEEKRMTIETVQREGFDYAFQRASDFTFVTDPIFHELRRSYIAVARALGGYFDPRYLDDGG